MLQTLHAMMAERRVLPVFGMNLGTIGFLMNEYQTDRLVERINAARNISFHPLSMKAVTVSGKTVNSPAINEVSLLRETRKPDKNEVSVDGHIRMAELVGDGDVVEHTTGTTRSDRGRGGREEE